MAVRFFRFAHAAGSGQRRPWWPATSPSRWRPTCSVSSAADATTEARPDQARGPSPAGPGGNPFPGLGWSVPSPGQEKTGDFDSSRPSPPNRARHRPLRCLSWAPAHRRDPRYEAGTGPRAPSGALDGARSSSRSPPDASSAWACSCCCGRAWPASWAGRARWCSPGPCRRASGPGTWRWCGPSPPPTSASVRCCWSTIRTVPASCGCTGWPTSSTAGSFYKVTRTPRRTAPGSTLHAFMASLRSGFPW